MALLITSLPTIFVGALKPRSYGVLETKRDREGGDQRKQAFQESLLAPNNRTAPRGEKQQISGNGGLYCRTTRVIDNGESKSPTSASGVVASAKDVKENGEEYKQEHRYKTLSEMTEEEKRAARLARRKEFNADFDARLDSFARGAIQAEYGRAGPYFGYYPAEVTGKLRQ